MIEPGKAVFLSYASQDADTARKICDALRAAGIEVWFDQSELRGGDAWDQKIRKQIKECTLFVPVISANTQARLEGYFRLEWKLAEDRSHLMARGKAFIVPVAIDSTLDHEAHVPDSFLAVQWTRLVKGEPTASFAQQISRLLETPASVARREESRTTSMPTGADRRRAWISITTVVFVLLGGGLLLKRHFGRERDGTDLPASSPANFSEARQLVERARAVYEAGDLVNRETYVLTEALLKKAEELDVTEAEAWALHAEVSRWLLWGGLDSSPERREALRLQAERALKLAPTAVSARLAYANMLLGGASWAPGEALTGRPRANTDEAERILKTLLAERPDDWRVLLGVSILDRRQGRTNEAIEVLQRARRLSDDHQAVTGDLLTALVVAERYAEAEAVVAEALPRHHNGRVLEFDVRLKLNWRGDAAAAAAALERWPAWMFNEDRGVQCAAMVWMWNRQPAKALAALGRFPRDYIRHGRFTGPRAALTAWLHEQAGNPEAARADWKLTIQVADRELAATPASSDALHWKAWALARLGDRTAAEPIVQELIERKSDAFGWNESTVGLVALGLVVGNPNWAFSQLEDVFSEQGKRGTLGFVATRAVLDLNPCFDAVRNDPRFQAIHSRAAAPDSNPLPSSFTATPDAKSVVVLPFANLSGDPEQEYFSDGLTEEILNALARERDLRVPGRASAFSFKGRGASAAEIAKALNVAQLVEGSVRKSGKMVRISVQLTRASDGFSEALPTVERELTDIFALQDEVARLVVEKLTKRTTTTAPVAVLTKAPEAYDAFLKGRGLMAQTSPFFPEAAAALRKSVELDPQFALAWTHLARVSADLYRFAFDPKGLVTSNEAIERARTLQPELPELHLARATYLLASRAANAEVEREIALAEKDRPNDPDVILVRAEFEKRPEVEMALLRRAMELDPRNGGTVNRLGNVLVEQGRYVEAEGIYRQAYDILGSSVPLTNRARLYLHWKADPELARRTMEEAPAAIRSDRYWSVRGYNLQWIGDFVGALEAFSQVKAEIDFGRVVAVQTAMIREATGDLAGARRDYERALVTSEKLARDFPNLPQAQTGLALVYAGLNRKEDALAAARRAADLFTGDGLGAAGGAAGSIFDPLLAYPIILARFDQAGEAFEVVRKNVESGRWRRNLLLRSTLFESLRKDPRFMAIAEKAPL